METFFISDTHFGHKNIIKYCSRPFETVEEMDQGMVDAWNKKVGKKDTVWHLGDAAFHNEHLLAQLNGFIHLVPGNHDLERIKRITPFVTDVHPELMYLKLSPTRRFALCHYPIESWRREYQYHLHGHMHGTGRKAHDRLDVGVDAVGFAPLSVEEVIIRINQINSGEA
jgi:calcineurin-like phosphoesterase family protein